MTSELAYGGATHKVRGIGARITQLLQVARDYNSAPDVKTMTIHEIQLFYSGLIPEIIKATK